MKPKNQTLGNVILDGAMCHFASLRPPPGCLAAFRHFADSFRPLWKITFAFPRKLARWKYPFQSMRHFHYHQTCEICMRFRSIDASATHIHKGLPLPPGFQHIHCTPVHHRYLGFDSFLQCPPSPPPPPLRSPHRSATAVPLTRSRTPSTKVGAPFRHR
jgi:hypothetical protein